MYHPFTTTVHIPLATHIDLSSFKPQTPQAHEIVRSLARAHQVHHRSIASPYARPLLGTHALPLSLLFHSDPAVVEAVVKYTTFPNVAKRAKLRQQASRYLKNVPFGRLHLLYLQYLSTPLATHPFERERQALIDLLATDDVTVSPVSEMFNLHDPVPHNWRYLLASHWRNWTPYLVKETAIFLATDLDDLVTAFDKNPTLSKECWDVLMDRALATATGTRKGHGRGECLRGPSGQALAARFPDRFADVLPHVSAQTYRAKEVVETWHASIQPNQWLTVIEKLEEYELPLSTVFPSVPHAVVLAHLKGFSPDALAEYVKADTSRMNAELFKAVRAPARLLAIRPSALVQQNTNLVHEIDTELVRTTRGIIALAKSGITPTVPVKNTTLAQLLASNAKLVTRSRSAIVASIPKLRTPPSP